MAELATRLAKIEENINQVFDIIVEEPPVETSDDDCDVYGNCVAPVECGDYDYDCLEAAGLLNGWFDALYWDKSKSPITLEECTDLTTLI